MKQAAVEQSMYHVAINNTRSVVVGCRLLLLGVGSYIATGSRLVTAEPTNPCFLRAAGRELDRLSPVCSRTGAALGRFGTGRACPSDSELKPCSTDSSTVVIIEEGGSDPRNVHHSRHLPVRVVTGHVDWDPSVFSPEETVVGYIERCSHCDHVMTCSVRCPCWQFLASHKFSECLNEVLRLVDTVLHFGAYPSDVEDLTVGLLGHVWEDHTPTDSTSLDELRRCEATMFLAGQLLPPAGVELVEQFTDGQLARACEGDFAEERRVGRLPCGAPTGDDGTVQHWRLAEMTTRDQWERMLSEHPDSTVPMCDGCQSMAEKEMAFTTSR